MTDENPFPDLGDDDEWAVHHPYIHGDQRDGTILAETEDDYDEQLKASKAALVRIAEVQGDLSPNGLLWGVVQLLSEMHGLPGSDTATVEECDPTGAKRAFYTEYSELIDTLQQAVMHLLGTCPGCGEIIPEVDPGGYVQSETGEAVRVIRSDAGHVHVEAQVAGGTRTIDRQYDRAWFDQHFVKADGVELLGGGF